MRSYLGLSTYPLLRAPFLELTESLVKLYAAEQGGLGTHPNDFFEPLTVLSRQLLNKVSELVSFDKLVLQEQLEVCKEVAEFRALDFRKWLVGHDNPFGEKVIKDFVIKSLNEFIRLWVGSENQELTAWNMFGSVACPSMPVGASPSSSRSFSTRAFQVRSCWRSICLM